MSADLRDRLKDAGVAAGSIYRDERPQGSVLPAVRFQEVGNGTAYTHDGRQSLRGATVQFDCMGRERSEADALADQVAALVETPSQYNATQFSGAFEDSVRRYSERAPEGPITYVTSLDMIVWHQPAA